MSERALGVRMTGCAGIELIALVLGQRAGYISNLSPWDYAPGGVLMETLGLKIATYYRRSTSFRWTRIVYWRHSKSFSRTFGDCKSVNNRQISKDICFFSAKMKILHYISERNSGIMACRVQCHQKRSL
jgi:hypothetical protein